MKSGELGKVARGYASYLPTPWERVGSEFRRREGDWVQMVVFNASRFTENYVPTSCMEFLKMPGPPTGAFLLQELRNPNATQRWVRISEPVADVFQEMVKQFSPPLLKPLNVSEIKGLLSADLNYWPHAYALCVMACEEGGASDAQLYFEAFVSATSDKPYPSLEARKQELAECLSLTASPEGLSVRLQSVRVEKLRALKLSP